MSETTKTVDSEEAPALEGEFELSNERPDFPGFSSPAESLEHDETTDHFGFIYETREEQFATVIPYIKQGLERDEHCLYIASDNTRADVLEALSAGGVNVDDALETGQLSVYTAEETYLDGGEFDADEARELLQGSMEEALIEYDGFRVTAEETWLVGDEARQEAFMTCEAYVNDIFDGEKGMALCQYNRTQLPADVIEDVIQTHPYLIYDGTVCENIFYTPPEEYFGPDRPARDNERKLQTLTDRTEARTTLETDEWAQQRLYTIASDPHRSFDEKVQDLLEFGRTVFDLEVGGVARVNPATDYYQIEAISGDHDELEPGTELPLSDTYCRRVVEKGAGDTISEPTEFSPATNGLPDHPSTDEHNVRTYLGTCVPINGDLDRTFFFTSSDPSDGSFSEKDRTFLRLMGQWIKYELERRHHERLLRDLYETIADPHASFTGKVEQLLDLGRKRFGLEVGHFTMADDDDMFEVVTAVGDNNKIEAGDTGTLCNAYCETLLASPSQVTVADASEIGWEDDTDCQLTGLDTYLATTVRAGPHEFGTLCFGSETARERPYTDAERTYLDLMGQWLSHELEQRRRERYLQRSYEITSDPGHTFEEKLEQLLELGSDWFGLEMGGLNHLPSWDGAFKLEKGIGLGADAEGELWVDPGKDRFCRQTITADEPVDMVDARKTDWADDQIHQELGVTSYLGTKVSSGPMPYGTLWFGSTEPRERPFSDDERMFIELMGQWVSYEIERREQRQAQEELYEITADSDLSFGEKTERLLDLGRDRFNLDMGFFLEKQGDEFRVIKNRGADLEDGVTTLNACPNQYCKQTITLDVPVGVEDAKAAGWGDDPLYTEHGLGCYLGTRVTNGDDVYGSVCFADSTSRDREFTDAEYAFLDLIGQWLSYELERNEHEQQLEQSNERLKESNARLEQFAYAASHDLQEPLRMVSSYLRLLESRYEDSLDEEGEEFLGFAVDGADRMRKMIEGLLQYSRVEARGEPLEPVDLNTVFEGVCDDLRMQIEETNAEITADELPPVRGDADQLRQVFQNLLSNAIKYSGDEAPRVHISATQRNGNRVISIHDEGIGIEQEEQERIFDIFDRLHSREEYDGTGIGLALCERILERHSGRIWVESEPGEGSTFSFTLQPPIDDKR